MLLLVGRLSSSSEPLVFGIDETVERLRAQSGAFLMSAFHERFEYDHVAAWNKSIPRYDHHTLVIPAECRKGILEELGLLHVTRETLYPSLDETTNAVTGRYASARPFQNDGAVD